MSCRANASAAGIACFSSSGARSISSSSRSRALLERAPEASSSEDEPALDRLALLEQLGVGAGHQLAHDGGVAQQEAGLHLQAPGLQDRAAGEAAQHVAAILVGGHDAVGDQERHAAGVVGEDAQRAVGGGVLAVAAAGELARPSVDQRLELVGLEHRVLAPAGSPPGG